MLLVGPGPATDTAGNFSELSLKGIAEPAMMVATGSELPVFFTGSESLAASAGGAAEGAAEVTGDDELPVVCRRPESFWAFAEAGAEVAAVVTGGDELPVFWEVAPTFSDPPAAGGSDM